MMHTASPISAAWSLAVHTTDDTRAIVAVDPLKRHEQAVSVGRHLQLSFALPPQDRRLPHAIEAHAHRAGLDAQRAPFRALIEHADGRLVLAARAGEDGRGIRLRGFFDLFNLTNSNAAETRTVSTGTSFLRPTAILAPRTARLGARLSF